MFLFVKNILKKPISYKILGFIIAVYIRFVYYTSKIEFEVSEAAKPFMKGEQNAVFAFWHSRLMMMPMIKPKQIPMHVLSSTHRDGMLISSAMHNFGFNTIYGSSTRGGLGAAINCIKFLRKGDNIAITPDGPKGPALQLHEGILKIAQATNKSIICVNYAASKHKIMKSWDKFMFAKPFSKIYYHVDIVFPENFADAEKIMLKGLEAVNSKL